MPVKDKATLRAEIEQTIEDNEQGNVSPGDIRSALLDIIDSISILSVGDNLLSSNFSTPSNGNTYAGQETSRDIDVEYNTGLGYFSLRANYSGNHNTAVGAYSLACNVYGSGNTAVGYQSLGGNHRGNNNTSLGKFALHNNKNGNFNIGIGHGAGYYIDDNDSYKFYLASYNIDESGMCNYPDGRPGTNPLLFGDLLNHRLVIGSDYMHEDGALQVNGSITPVSSSGTDDLGSNSYPWNTAFIRYFDSDNEAIESNRDIDPREASIFDLGSDAKPWRNIWVDNLHVNSLADITDINYITIDNSQFYDKQIHLASSGVDSNNNAMPYLTDEGIDGAGLVVRSSGTDYLRTYFWTYKAPDLDWDCVETENAFSRSAWLSNISIEIMDGRQLKTQRVVSSDSLALVGDNCYGMFIDEGIIIGTDDDRDNYDDDYYKPEYISFAYGNYASFLTSRSSGVFLEDNLLSRYDGSSNLVGFKRRYLDDDNSLFVLSSHASGQVPKAQFVSMRDRAAFGFSDDTTQFIPRTLLNTKASGDAIFRHTGTVSSRIQLSSPDNLFTSGVEIYYTNGTSKFGLSTKEGSVVRNALTVSGDIFGINNTNPFSTVTIGRDRNSKATISLEESSGTPIDRADYGTLIVRPVSHPDLPNSLFYRNEYGNEYDLLLASGNKMAPEYVYYDDFGNTFVGYNSLEHRFIQTQTGYVNRNTTLGNSALQNLGVGNDNIAIGAYAGKGMLYGSNNIFIGTSAGQYSDETVAVVYNQFRLGNSDTNLLMSGELPNGTLPGFVFIQSEVGVVSDNNVHKFSMKQSGADTIFNKSTSGEVVFKFLGTNTALTLQESGILVPKITFNDGTYFTSSSGTKFSEGSAITFSLESGTDRRSINIDIDKLDTNDDMFEDSYLIVSNSGENFKSSILNLARFINPDNPEMFFDCGGGYNILISRNSDVSNSTNCNNIVGGWKAGDDISGFTNSVIFGSKAGQEATMQNPDLSIDIAAIFIGYNAGRQSHNADNSIFIGPSAGQNSENCDNSIFIGSSAGQSTSSSKSIAIGDNTLTDVDGENNLEIVADWRPNNRLINGAMSNKFNIAGVIAGDTCSGRVSVGGAARVYPHAVLEVDCSYGDHETRLQEWYNGYGELVAYMDQEGNLILKGIVIENNTYLGEDNLHPAVQLNPDVCGNTNSGGSVPIPGENNNEGGGSISDEDSSTTSYSLSVSNPNVVVAHSSIVTIKRFGGTLGNLGFTISTTGGVSAPSSIIIPNGVNTMIFAVSGNTVGAGRITSVQSTLGTKYIDLNVTAQDTTSPTFTVAPSISPGSANTNTVFTGNPGTVINGTITSRIWKLNGTVIANNTNTVTPTSAGALTLTVIATGTGGVTTQIASATVNAVFSGTYSGAPNPATVALGQSATITVTRSGSTASAVTVLLFFSGNAHCSPSSLSFGVGESVKTFSLTGLHVTARDEVYLNNNLSETVEYSVTA